MNAQLQYYRHETLLAWINKIHAKAPGRLIPVGQIRRLGQSDNAS